MKSKLEGKNRFEGMKWDRSGLTPAFRAFVRVKLLEPMLGTVPGDQGVYERYIIDKIRKALKRKDLDPEWEQAYKEALKAAGKEEVETLPETDEKGHTSFHVDTLTGELFLYDYTVRGFLKSAAEALKDRHNLTSFKKRIDKWVFPFPRRILLGKKEIDGVLERPLRADTAQGPRVALAKSDFVEADTEFEFEVQVMNKAKISIPVLKDLFRYGMYQGFGQFRNGSYGRFVFMMDTEEG